MQNTWSKIIFKLLYQPLSPMQESPRPLLVFWLWWLGTLGCIVCLFVTIIIDDLADIFPRPRSSSRKVGYITPNSCSDPGRLIVWPPGLSIFLIVLFFLLLFLSLLGGFSIIGMLRSRCFQFLRLKLWFFNLRFLCWLTLHAGLGCWRSTTLEAVLIGFASIKTGPKGGLGFSINCFFD